MKTSGSAEKLWKVVLDGVFQPNKFAAKTENEAIDLWRKKTGKNSVARKRLSARPDGAPDATAKKGRAKRPGADSERPDSWYILVVERGKGTRDLGEGPFDTEEDARRFAKNEVGASWVLFKAPPGTAARFLAEKDRVYENGPDTRTDWYILKVGRNKVATVLTEGPSSSKADAKAFAKAEVPGKWVVFLAPAGTAKAFEAEKERFFSAMGPSRQPGKRMTVAEEADARGETELTDEATTPGDRAEYEKERAAKRSRAARKGARTRAKNRATSKKTAPKKAAKKTAAPRKTAAKKRTISKDQQRKMQAGRRKAAKKKGAR